MVNEKIIALTLKKYDEIHDDALRIPCHVNHIWPLLLVLASISDIYGAGREGGPLSSTITKWWSSDGRIIKLREIKHKYAMPGGRYSVFCTLTSYYCRKDIVTRSSANRVNTVIRVSVKLGYTRIFY